MTDTSRPSRITRLMSKPVLWLLVGLVLWLAIITALCAIWSAVA